MKNKTINIAYILSNEEFHDAVVSLHSVLTNNKNSRLDFSFVVNSHIKKEYVEYFERKLKKCANVMSCQILYVDETKYNNYYKNPKIEKLNRIYLLDLPEIINKDKFLYISTHTIVNGNLKELFDTDITNNSCAGVEYVNPKSIFTYFGVNISNVFSNNILLINSKKWLEKEYNKCLFSEGELKNYSSNMNLPVWIYLNLVIKDCKFLPYKYDYTEEYWNSELNLGDCSAETKAAYKKFLMHLESPITLYIPTPLSVDNICKNSYLGLWWKYAEQTDIYSKIKDYKTCNIYKLTATSAQNSFKYAWLLSRIFPYIKPYLFRIFLGFLIAVPLGLLDGITAFALKPYMDYVIGGKTLDFNVFHHSINISSLAMAFILPIGVILFAAIQGVLRYLNDYISAWTSQKITNDVKFDLFHRLIHMHPQFFDDNSSGIVISRYMGDPGAASAGIVDQIKSITTDVFGALGLIAVMIYSSCKLAFIGVLVLCIAFIPVALLRKRIKEASNKNMIIGGNITTNINETYSGNKVMAAYDLQDRQESYFKEQIGKSFNLNMSLTKRAAWMSPLMYLIASCGIAIVLGYGTYLINTGHMTAGSFASFVTSLLLLYKPVKGLGGTFAGIQNVFVAMGRMFELFDLEPSIKDCENPIEMKGFEREIRFENVNFEYIPNKPILKNINLTIPKNETLAIVGNSGGGKSTLVNLLPRFYDIKLGSIKFDGIDIKGFSIKSLRKNISMVFQDNFLYSGTIKENIMMGNPDATAGELMQAIKSAHLQDMIQELPEGLETELGERGLTLSGGQRQRVAIARAMLRNAPIVILDEATSALDNESEAIVQKAMDNLMQNRTVFIIAHRLSTIKNADRIAVINEGELVELGSHEELIKIEDGQYKHLYDMQFKKQEAIS